MSKYNLSDAEYEIMEYIWDTKEELTFVQIVEFTVQKGHVWKKQTVQTFLSRMIGKGVLTARKAGIRSYYSPKETKVEWISRWTRGIVREEFDNSLKTFLSAFTGGKKLTEQEAKDLHEFLDQ